MELLGPNLRIICVTLFTTNHSPIPSATFPAARAPHSLLEKMPTGGPAVPAKAEDRVANADIVVVLGSDQRIQSN